MEEEIDPSKEYVAAFNLGYKLNQVSPEIAELLDHLPAKQAKLDALRAGIAQHQKENQLSRQPSWLKQDRFESNSNDKAPDKEDTEPEK